MNKVYFKNVKGKRSDPMDIDQIKHNLYRDDLIWFEGIENWTKASEIDELKEYTLLAPPITESEKKNKILIKSIKPTILFYFVFSIFLGCFSGMLEGFQYASFQRKIDKQVKYLKSEGNYNTSGISRMELYVENPFNDDLYTRWSSYYRGQDNEQTSYNKRYSLFFRPYKAIYTHANLSKSERNNFTILILNFILSALVTNLILLPFIYLYNIKRQKKKIKII